MYVLIYFFFLSFARQMKYCIVIALAVAVTLCAARPQTKYTTKYDNIDIEQILRSDRLFNNYFKCLMDEGKCTPDGRELKRVLPDALQTNCEKCSEQQRTGTERVVRYLIDNKPAQWDTLRKKYDPQNIYATKYSQEARNLGIPV